MSAEGSAGQTAEVTATEVADDEQGRGELPMHPFDQFTYGDQDAKGDYYLTHTLSLQSKQLAGHAHCVFDDCGFGCLSTEDGQEPRVLEGVRSQHLHEQC